MKIIKCQNCGEEYFTAGLSAELGQPDEMKDCPACRVRQEQFDLGLISLQANGRI